MALFSERFGYTVKPFQLETISDALKNRIWNVYSCEVSDAISFYDSHYLEEILDSLGLKFQNVDSFTDVTTNLKRLQKWFDSAKWYQIFDFIEIYMNILPTKDRKDARKNFNDILEIENSGYRVLANKVVPITNNEEIKCIEKAQQSEYESVNIHITKALELFSKRPNADYENSIKESISAVEALCCIITNDKKATLGDALKKLETKGVKLHRALQNAMSSLYGYTSDEGGIRHGSIDFVGASSEDAKYMLISCSAFVNYLIEKWSKVTEKTEV